MNASLTSIDQRILKPAWKANIATVTKSANLRNFLDTRVRSQCNHLTVSFIPIASLKKVVVIVSLQSDFVVLWNPTKISGKTQQL